MKSNCLFIEVNLNGHVLEWIYHLFNYSRGIDSNFFFVLPKSFAERKRDLEWMESPNVSVLYLTDIEEYLCNKGNPLKCAWECTKVISKYVKQTNATTVFQTFLMRTQPFLSFFLPSKVTVSGVIYRIYLYDENKSFFRRFAEKIRYFILARSKSIKNVFLLNDKVAPNRFNQVYKTNKFSYLPDPFYKISGTFNDLRGHLGISTGKKIFFQFGSLDERKSTMTILKAIEQMDIVDLKDKCFIFSGRISPSIKSEFDSIVKELSSKVQIIVLDGFIPYSQLNDMCYTCDYIFVLYTNHQQSSGTLGYAAYFKKNVIGTSHGLLGNIIKDYKLGKTIDVLDTENIKKSILEAPTDYHGENYIESHDVNLFCETIFRYM